MYKSIGFNLPVDVLWVGVGSDIEQGNVIKLEVPGLGQVVFKPLTYHQEYPTIYFGAMEILTNSPYPKLANTESLLISGVYDQVSGHMVLRNGPPPLPEKKPTTESGEIQISRYLACY